MMPWLPERRMEVYALHDELTQERRFQKLMATVTLAGDAVAAIAQRMAERNVNKAELARLLGKSRSWVTQLLNGKASMTIGTLAEALFVLDATARLEVRPIEGLQGADGSE